MSDLVIYVGELCTYILPNVLNEDYSSLQRVSSGFISQYCSAETPDNSAGCLCSQDDRIEVKLNPLLNP